jgi:hypothetical protein
LPPDGGGGRDNNIVEAARTPPELSGGRSLLGSGGSGCVEASRANQLAAAMVKGSDRGGGHGGKSRDSGDVSLCSSS